MYLLDKIVCIHSAKRYENFIKSRQKLNQSRTLKEFENHHIIPKSLGGSNSKDNLVKLTPREHYIAHLILYYTYKNISMASALCYMSRRKNIQHYNSRLYSTARIAYLKTLSDYKKENSTKGMKVHTKEYKEKMSKRMSGKRNSFYGKTHTEETKKKIATSLKGKNQGGKNPVAKKVSIKGVTYECGKIAAEVLNISSATLSRRCNSKDTFLDWFFI